jgi:predicted benzoate:H+ symporter BenE
MEIDQRYAVADCVAACGRLTIVCALFGAREICLVIHSVAICYDHVV